MLFFIDETWQEIGGQAVAALGAISMPTDAYNGFCKEVFAMKKNRLGAIELRDAELKGAKCFAKRSFRARAEGESKLLDIADELFSALEKYGAHTFVSWTTDPSLATLRSAHTQELSRAYKQLLFAFRAYMRAETPKDMLGSLNFDQRDIGSDEATACSLQNYLVRTFASRVDLRWDRQFLTVPNFTVSAVSPGLQAADLTAYIGAHFASPGTRAELAPYRERLRHLQYVWIEGKKTKRGVREVRAPQKK